MKRAQGGEKIVPWAEAHWDKLPGVNHFEVQAGTLCVHLDDTRALEYLPNEVEGMPVRFILERRLSDQEAQGTELFREWQRLLSSIKAGGAPEELVPTYQEWLEEEGYL